jgi:chromate transporter
MKPRSPVEVLQASLPLGLTSFGGPIAHLGYFNREYVQKRRWLSAEEYAAFVSLCQLLPGPTSSQVGFLIGLHRAGIFGALAAWVGFTLPSAILMYAFAVLGLLQWWRAPPILVAALCVAASLVMQRLA